jgi:phosphoribosylformylglycinamidine cyclo-ligase
MKQMTYKDAGVDIEAGYEVVKRVKKLGRDFKKDRFIGGIGGFGGAYSLKGLHYKEPVLVSGMDGVGTKIKIAFMMNKHDTIGIDLVAMNADDVVVCGAKPLFFLDYIACHKVEPNVIEDILKGIVKGCKQAGCLLVGGETAEMSDLYAEGEYDLAGVAVGIADRKKLLDKKNIKAGDQLIGLASSGLHSNGYTLARKVLLEAAGLKLNDKVDGLERMLGEELLEPTRIYAGLIVKLLEEFHPRVISHITGGGFPENIGRLLPPGIGVKIKKGSWQIPPIFGVIQKLGNVAEEEMYKVFNMGIGMVLVVPKQEVSAMLKFLKQNKEKAYLIGETIKGKQGVIIKE